MSPESDEPENQGGGRPGPTRSNADPLRRLAPGSLLSGRYRIGTLRGVGGMGVVYGATDEQLGVSVAVKFLRPELAVDSTFMERFRRELILGRQVSHPNVVRIHDIGRDGDVHFLTMDLVAGSSLRELIEQRGPLDEPTAILILRQLAEALGAAHRAGVVHRDLKPSNILIDEQGQVHVTDFGVAASLGSDGPTRTGEVIGTLDYMSPEQARGDTVDARSDIYALGIVLFEMLSGRLPFAGGSAAEALAQRIAGKRRDLRDLGVRVSPSVRNVLARCLVTSPSRRYRSTEELLVDLDNPRRARIRRFLGRAAVVAALALLGLGAVWGVLAILHRSAGNAARQGVAAAAPQRTSIAVLPLRDETGDPALAWMSSGIAEMLADTLAQSPRLQVVDGARVIRTVEDLKLSGETWPDTALVRFGEIFNSDRLVVGSARSRGGVLRVDARLVALGPGGVGRTMAISSEAEKPGALVEELGRAIRASLDVPVPADAGSISNSPAALSAYERGSRLLLRGDAVLAVPELRGAVAADPGFGLAWLRLAEACEGTGQTECAQEAVDHAVGSIGGSESRLGYLARARQAMLRGRPEAAEGTLRELVKRFPGDLEAAVAHAEALARGGQLVEAMQELQQVTQHSPNHPKAWFLLGKFAILSGDSRKAVDEYLVRAMVAQNMVKSDQGRADVLNALGVAWRELGDLQQAEDNYSQASELRQRIGDRRGYATTLRNLAQIRLSRGQQDQAEKTLRAAMELFKSLDDRAGLADTLNDFGVLEEGRGRNTEALARYREALQIRRGVGDRRGEAESLNNVGYAYHLLGESDNASAYWNLALAVHRETGNREGVILVTQSLGQLQISQGQWDLAVKSFLSALEDSRAMELRSAEAASLGYLGRLAQYQGRYAAALSFYAEALGALEALKDAHGLAEFSLARAENLLEMGRLDEADADLGRAGSYLEATPNLEQHAEWQRLRSGVRVERGDFEGAASGLSQARRELRGNASPVSILGLDIDDGTLLLQKRRVREAARALETVEARAERLGDMPLKLKAAEAAARAALLAGESQKSEKLVAQALRWVNDCGTWSGTHRLYRIQGAVEKGRGKTQASEASFARAALELERMQQGLDAAHASALRDVQAKEAF